jgi:hypothetical protein
MTQIRRKKNVTEPDEQMRLNLVFVYWEKKEDARFMRVPRVNSYITSLPYVDWRTQHTESDSTRAANACEPATSHHSPCKGTTWAVHIWVLWGEWFRVLMPLFALYFFSLPGLQTFQGLTLWSVLFRDFDVIEADEPARSMFRHPNPWCFAP